MTNIDLHPNSTYVRWGCKRCGHRGGMAKSLVPLPFDFSDTQIDCAYDVIVKSLRRVLVRKHWMRQHCLALESDFIIERCNPYGDLMA